MITALIYFLSSVLALFIFACLFRYESRRGVRFLNGIRSHIDFWFLKIRHVFNVQLRNWSRYFVRQIIHYFLHTFLTGSIKGLRTIEEQLRAIAQSNRTLARKSDTERNTKNKLEEIAIHKMEVALSDEEKKMRRHRSLEG